MKWQVFIFVVHAVCLFATISMTLYCTVEFIKNEDVSEVFYKTFDGDYPDLTLCFNSPYIDEKLSSYGNGITPSSYGSFLSGGIWDEQMVKINYDNVTIDISDYLLETCIRSSYTEGGNKCNVNYQHQLLRLS